MDFRTCHTSSLISCHFQSIPNTCHVISTGFRTFFFAEKWCAWDEDLDEEKAYFLFIPEWSLYHRMSLHIGQQAIDLAPGTSADTKKQTFLHLIHVPMPDVLYHLSIINQELQDVRAAHRHDRRQLNLIMEHLASREPDLAHTFGLNLRMDDLHPGAPHGHR